MTNREKEKVWDTLNFIEDDTHENLKETMYDGDYNNGLTKAGLEINRTFNVIRLALDRYFRVKNIDKEVHSFYEGK